MGKAFKIVLKLNIGFLQLEEVFVCSVDTKPTLWSTDHVSYCYYFLYISWHVDYRWAEQYDRIRLETARKCTGDLNLNRFCTKILRNCLVTFSNATSLSFTTETLRLDPCGHLLSEPLYCKENKSLCIFG